MRAAGRRWRELLSTLPSAYTLRRRLRKGDTIMAKHIRPKFAWCLCLATCALGLSSAAEAGEPGSAGLLALRLGLGARSGAMGETGAALATDATAAYWNPANLVNAPGTQVTLQHMEYFEDFRMESVAVSHNTPMGALGLSFMGFYVEPIARYDETPVGVQVGSFRPYDLAVGLSYAYDFKDVSVGITGKFLYERVDLYDGSGAAVDLGVVHRTKLPGLVLGVALQNYGSKFKLNQQEYDLPVTLRMGASYNGAPGSAEILRRTTLAGDIVVPNDGNARLHAGGEFRIHEAFALRVGHRASYDTWGPTFGAGFHRRMLDIDYAYMANENDFDDNHRVSISLAFGGAGQPQP